MLPYAYAELSGLYKEEVRGRGGQRAQDDAYACEKEAP